MERDPADTSVLTFGNDEDGDGCACYTRADADKDAVETEAGGAEALVRYRITSGEDSYEVEVYWPKDTGLSGARVTGIGDLPKGWEAEFWFSDEKPLGWLVLNVPLDAKVEVV